MQKRFGSIVASLCVGLGTLAACSTQPASAPLAQTPPPASGPTVEAPSATAPTDTAPPPVTPAPSGSTAAGPKLSPDGKMCGGIAGFQCPDKQFCSFAPEARCGAGDMTGTCKPLSEMCTMEYAPVCGCDDKTYSSVCVAGRTGVSVKYTGECKTGGGQGVAIAEGKLCGTRGVPGECEAGLYCAYKSQCGATDAGGTCTKKPQACTKIYQPVCGCDGKTYGNACSAASEGASVASTGPCKTK